MNDTDLIEYLRKFIPPLTHEQVNEIAKEAEAIVREKVKAENENTPE